MWIATWNIALYKASHPSKIDQARKPETYFKLYLALYYHLNSATFK